jgi:protocatechuate 3,4-dioxygenase beta subunit
MWAVAACVPVQPPAEGAGVEAAGATPAVTAPAATAGSVAEDCLPTPPDMLGPFYVAGAPVRDRVGAGYVLAGVVRSAARCAPLAEAMVEFWLAGPDGEYTDDMRATLYSAQDGAYRFESPAPPPYAGRPPHIHVRVSAAGYATLVTQHYPEPGRTEAMFDLVLTPE